MTEPLRYGFRILGSTHERRRLVDAAVAFKGYANCDPNAKVQQEAYLSAFNFGDDFRELLKSSGSVKGYSGPCWASWIWFDFDGDLDRERIAAARLASTICDRFLIDDDLLLCFFSGAKGFHVGIPTSLWRPEPAADFNKIARCFAESIADKAGVTIDNGVYDRVRPFRAPNSRHPKTGFYKRRLLLDELVHLSIDCITAMASAPEPFEVCFPSLQSERAAADWRTASEQVKEAKRMCTEQRTSTNGTPKLNRQTLEIIRDSSTLAVGDRHRLLFSAAANIGEFKSVRDLAFALLTESGLDSGLPPKDVRRQIDCGLAHGGTTNG